MRIAFVFFVGLIIAAACNTSRSGGAFDQREVRPHVMDMVQVVIDDGFLSTENIGRNPEVSEAYTHRMALIHAANLDELVALLDHPAGIIRAVAFEGLAVNDYARLKAVLLDLSEEDRVVRYIHGDLDFTLPLIEYAYTVVLGRTVRGESPVYANDDPPVSIDLTAAEEAFIVNRILAVRDLIP